MTCPAMANAYETSTPDRLNPPPVRLPKLVQGVGFAFFQRKAMRNWINRHGHIFEINVPFFGRSVVVSDAALVRSVCTASTEQLINVQPNVGNWFGPGSIFALDGSRHRDRRRLLAPAFHGQRLKDYETITVDETMRESANWPENEEFRIFEPMNRITLNVILRILFGADGAELEELCEIVPSYMKLGQLMAFVPTPPRWTGRHGPWGKLDEVRKALDRIVFTLIDRAEDDSRLGERADILALLLRTRRDDGTEMSRLDICDELLTLIGAGHETTGTALSWAFERLRRHPDVLAELVREVDEGGSDLRRATIFEVLRVRTVIDSVGRRVRAPNFDSAGGGFRMTARCSCALPICTRIRKSSLTPNDSTRIASAAPSRQHQHGWHSVAEHGGASALISRSPKWISCCGRCCRISASRPMPPPMRSRISGESPMSRNSAAA
jgi:cytochrome P450 family 138